MKRIIATTYFLLFATFLIQTTIAEPDVLGTFHPAQSRVPCLAGNLVTWLDIDEVNSLIKIYKYEIGADTEAIELYSYDKEGNLAYPPYTDGRYVVWCAKADSDSNWDIFLWDIGKVPSDPDYIINISDPVDNAVNDYAPYVSGGKVVWFAGPISGTNSQYEIWKWDSENGKKPVTTDAFTNDCRPKNYFNSETGVNNIVWQSSNGNFNQVCINSAGTEYRIPAAALNNIFPVLDKWQIVWTAGSNIKQFLIAYIDAISKPVINISAGSTNNSNPHTCEGMVVWQGSDGHDLEIYMWDQEDGTLTKITDNDTDDEYPYIYVDPILTDNRRIVWQGFDGNDTEIYLYANNRITPLTHNNNNDCRPQVYGDAVVWEHYDDNGFYEIHLLKDAVAPSIEVYCSSFDLDKEEWIWSDEVEITGQVNYGSHDGNGQWQYWRVWDGELVDTDWTNFDATPDEYGFDTSKHEGIIDLYVRLQDENANSSNVVHTYMYLDGTSPNMDISGLPGGFTNDLPVTLNITAWDQADLSTISSVEYYYDGVLRKEINDDPNDDNLITFSLDIFEDTSITFTARDEADNSVEQTVTIQIDQTGPNIVSLTLEDAGGGQLLEHPDGKIWTNSDSVTALMTAVDSQCKEIDPDLWAYQLVRPGTVWIKDNYTIEPGDPGDPVNFQKEFVESEISADGKYSAHFRAADILGNVSLDNTGAGHIPYIIFNVDRTDPYYLSVTGCEEWSNNSADFIAIAEATDDLAGIEDWYYIFSKTQPALDDPGWISGDTTNDCLEIINFNQGENHIWFKVVDKAGNPALSGTVVRRDTEKPRLDISTQGWSNGTVEAEAADDHSQIDPDSWRWTLDDLSLIPFEDIPDAQIDWQLPVSYSAVSATADVTATEEQTVWFIVYDKAGNYDCESVTLDFDTVFPEISLETQGWSNGEEIEVEITDDGGSGINTCAWQVAGQTDWTTIILDHQNRGKIDVSQYVEDTQVLTQVLDIVIMAGDNAGNIKQSPASVQVDRTKPTVTIEATPGFNFGTWTNTDLFEISITVDDDITPSAECTKKVSINNSVFNFCEDVYTVSTVGKTRLVFRGIDGVGNEQDTGVYEVWIDRGRPYEINFTLSGGIQEEEWTNILPIQIAAEATDDYSGVDPDSWYYHIVLPSQTTIDNNTNTVELDNNNLVNEGVNQVTFGVSDKVGNGPREDTVNIWIDTQGPVIDADAADYANEWLNINTLSFTDINAGFNDTVSWFYTFDVITEDFKQYPETITPDGPLAEAENIAIGLDTGQLGEGNHTLYLKVQDKLGNESLADYEFYIDLTTSVITGITVQGLASEEQYSPVAIVTIEVEVDDDTNLAGFEYTVMPVFTVNPLFDHEYSLANGNEPFPIELVSDGINYLYIRTKEQGGLTGNHAVKIIRLDTGQPGPPAVESLTHPRAVSTEDAVAIRDAVFTVIPSSQEINLSGISGYEYKLLKGTTLVREGFATEDNLIQITELDDNGEGEFYYLNVQAIGGNGKPGAYADTYTFRVDTKPPVSLKVTVTPHSNPEYWYPDADVTLEWNKPQDMTGIKSYYYKLAPDEELLAQPADWTATNERKAEVNLESILGETYGEAFFEVWAEDFADNIQDYGGSLHFDVQKPELEIYQEPDTFIEVIPNLPARTALVRWGAPYDEGSGFSRLEIQKTRIVGQTPEPNPVWHIVESSVIVSGANEFTLDGLNEEDIYRVNIKVVDQAGNETIYHKDFRLDGQPVNIEVHEPFSMMLNGYRVYGIWSTDPAQSEVYLELPASLELRQKQTDSGEETELNQIGFSEFEFIPNTVFQEQDFLWGSLALEENYVFVFDVAEFKLQADELYFSAANGLSFNNIDYTAQLTDEQTQTFGYANAGFSRPPRIYFKSCSTAQSEEFAFDSYYYDDVEGEYLRGWMFTGVTQTYFDDVYWMLDNGKLDTRDIFNTDIYVQSGNENIYQLPVSAVQVTPQSTIGEGQIESAFYLEKGGNLFFIDKGNAFIQDNKIIILKAEIYFDLGLNNETIVVEIENFSIDSNGKIQGESCFTIAEFIFYDAYGNKYKVVPTSVYFDEDGNLVIGQGSINDAIGYRNLIIKKDELEYSISEIDPFQALVHGYTITSSSGVLTAQGIMLETASITNFPDQYGGLDQTIEGLGLVIEDYSVYNAGVSNEPFNFSPDYDREITVERLELNNAGLYAASVAVPLPAALGGQTVNFSYLPLLYNGTIGESLPKQEPVVFQAESFSCQGQLAVFDGTEIKFDSVDVVLPEECYPRNVSFTGFKADGLGVTSGGTYTGRVSYSNFGWDFNLDQLNLSEQGVKARASVWLPYEFGNRVLEFPDFKLISDSGFDSGQAGQNFFIRIHDWKVEISNISIQEDKLVCGRGVVRLYSTMGFGELVFQDNINGRAIVLNSDGTVFSCVEGTTSVGFLAENGFLVEAEKYKFTDSGLVMKGKVYFPAGLEQSPQTVFAEYNEFDITLEADGVIITEPSSESVDYYIAGWQVEAEDYWFDRQGLTIEKNYLQVFGFSICVPHVIYYADGGIKVAGHSFEGFNLPLFGFEMGVTEILFTEQGLNLKAFVTLPDVLGGYSLYFDKLTLHPDGSITTDVAVREYDFDLFGFSFLLRNIRLDGDGLAIGEGIITLPPELESKRIHLLHFRIKADGSFELGGLGFDPFELWGFIFHINYIEFGNDIVTFGGSITLPDYLVEGLAGRRLDIENFTIPLDGGAPGFKATLEGEYPFEIAEGWQIVASDMSVEKPQGEDTFWIMVNQARLIFPEDFTLAEEVSISGVRINPLTGEIDFSSIIITTDLNFSYFGFDFTLNTLSISADFDFTFSGSVVLPDYFPEVFSGETVTVDVFEIFHTGEIGDVSVSLEEINGDLWDTLYLTGASLYFTKEEGMLYLGCNGVIELKASAFPTDMCTNSLTIHEFKMSVDTGQNEVSIDKFSASTATEPGEKINFELFGLQVKDAVIHVEKNPEITGGPAGSDIEVSVEGAVVLPDTLPTFLKNQEVNITRFKINLAGTDFDFAAGFSSGGDYPLFSGVLIRNPSVNIEIVNKAFQFTIGGDIVFSDAFPEGLAGLSFDFSDLVFDTDGNIYLPAVQSISIPDIVLFNELPFRNGEIEFIPENNDIKVSIKGDLVLPDFFQVQGEPERILSINEFLIDSDGKIDMVSASANIGDINLFDVLTVEDLSLSVTNEGNDDFIFSCSSGNLLLPAAVKSAFPDLPDFVIDEITFSTKEGLQTLDIRPAGASNLVNIDFIADITFLLTSFEIDEQGIKFSGKFRFPNTFPVEGLKGESFDLDSFKIGWDGTIRELDASISQITVKLGGFTAEIKDLSLNADEVSLGSCIIELPASMNSMKLGFKDAHFDANGNFHGQFELPGNPPVLDVDIAGFRVALYNPGLNITTHEITFSRAGLKLPAFIGGAELDLYGVKITPASIVFSGGNFRLPDFVIAGGLGFRNIYVNFKIDGSKYKIAGGGKILIPGAGIFGVEVSFVNKSDDYPWGLESANFSYKASGLGMPLGVSGLYINGLRGGLAFGPPKEVPEEVRDMFDSSMRLSIGLTMTGPAGGNIVKADADVWVDINDWEWAFEGNVSVLRGFVKAWLVAAVTKRGFYGNFGVELAFIRGEVTVYIFPYNGRTQVSGEGRVQFILREGCIVDEEVDMIFFTLHIVIPPCDISLPWLGAAFGLFTNGEEGFTAFVDVPVFGKIGMFMPRGGWPEFGNVDRYELYDPFKSSAMMSQGGSINTKDSSLPEDSKYNNKSRVMAMDDIIKPGVKDRYNFTVPGAQQKKLKSLDSAPDGALGNSAPLFGDTPAQEVVERLVFLIAYTEGDPLVTPVSPSGKKYYEGDADVKVEYFDWGKAMVVFNPEAGLWTAEVSNVLAIDFYHIEVYGRTMLPQIEVQTPAFAGQHVDDSFNVSGTALTNNGTEADVTIYLATQKDSFIGKPLTKITAQADNSFSVDIDASELMDGTYYIYAGIIAGKNPEKFTWAPGSILVKHDENLLAVTELIATEKAAGEIHIAYRDNNGERTNGFNLYIDNLTTGQSEKIWLGYLLNITIPGYEAGHTLRISVAAVDELNREGERSAYVNLTMGDDKEEINRFNIIEENLTLDLEISKVHEGVLNFETIAAPVVTGTAYDYLEATLDVSVNELHIGFDTNIWNVTEGSGTINYMIRPDETMSPGVYTATIYLENKGNNEIRDQVNITVNLTYPEIIVNRVIPLAWHMADGCEIEVFGEYFFAGTRLYLDDRELIAGQATENYFKAAVGTDVEGGMHELRIVGAGGDQVIQPVEVLVPYYIVKGFKTRAPIMAGSNGDFFFTIKGENRFSGTAGFNVGQTPAGWQVMLAPSGINENELAVVSVVVPADAELGEYIVEIISDQADIMPLTITVTDTYPDPHVSSLSLISGFTGDILTVFGYGFGSQGTVKLGDVELPVITYNQDAITVQLPDGVVTGEVTVTVDGQVSNGVLFYIKDRGFTVQSEKEEIELKAGEQASTQIYVKGYEKNVELELSADTDMIDVSLDKYSIIPNDSTVLNVNVYPDTADGTYSVIITGTSGNIQVTEIINIIVGRAFKFVTEELPAGVEDAGYGVQVETENGTGSIIFGIEEGDLPLGLALKRDGTITGRPLEVGTFYFIIKAEDGEERIISKTYSITVEENNWAMDNKDSGNTRYNPVKSPADNRKRWTSSRYTGARQIITGGKMVFILCDDGVVGLEAATGTIRYRINGIFRQWAYAHQNLYLLDNERKFRVVDAVLGNSKWQREGVACFTTDGNILYLAENGIISVVDPVNGTLTGQIQAQMPAEHSYIWQNGELLRTDGSSMYLLTENGWLAVFEDQVYQISDVAADQDELAVLLEAGQLLILNTDYEVLRQQETGLAQGIISLGQERIVIAADSGIMGLTRSDMQIIFYENSGCLDVAGALEKVFIVNEYKLEALNGYNGSAIWTVYNGHKDLALTGERLYALDEDGAVTCYNGTDNLYYPTTNIDVFPAQPDGENGYYITRPLVELQATDAETFVSETWYRYGETPFILYTGIFELDEGQNSLVAYSIDSNGYREPDNLKALHVDVTAPVTELTEQGTMGQKGYYLTPVEVSLVSTDNLSGVEYTEYMINDGGWDIYNGSLLFNNQGEYVLKWRAKDFAGNYEQISEKVYRIDLEDPVASASGVVEPGLGLVYLEGEDDGSGIDRIEYRLDGGEISIYINPIAITQTGTHTVIYRAVDMAGRTGIWQTITLEVPSFESGDWIKDLRFAYWQRGREVVRDVQVGERIYAPCLGRHNRLKILPEYLIGADYIRTHLADRHFWGNRFMWFTAGADIDVFIMKHKNSLADLSGWQLVEEDFPVEPRVFFRGGADIYTRKFSKGEEVVIPGSHCMWFGWGNLVFVQYAQSNYIKITSPRPEKELIPLDKVRYTAVVLTQGDFSRQWYLRYGQEEWQTLGNAESGEITLPYVEDELEMSLKLVLQNNDTGQELEKTEHYLIVNKARVELLQPLPGTEILAGDEKEVNYRTYNIKGELISNSQTSWQASRDGANWQDIEFEQNKLAVPGQSGVYYLKAELEDAAGQSKSFIFEYNIVEKYSPVNIIFGSEEGEYYTLGEPLSIQQNGKFYGFNTNHTDRCGCFYYKKRDYKFGTMSYIRLKPDAYFAYRCPPGKYRVAVTMGPLYRWEHTRTKVEGIEANIYGGRQCSVKRVVYVVELTDGMLTITGQEGLPIVKVEIEHLAPDDESPPGEYRVEHLWGIQVLCECRDHGHHGHGRRK